MCPSHLLSATLLVTAGLTSVSAADLTTIDRTLKDEPKYATPAPKYCLVVFGPEAKTHVWLVHDGDVVHVLASPDGVAPKKWRHIKGNPNMFSLGDVWEDGGKTCYKNLHYYHLPRRDRLRLGLGRNAQIASEDRSGTLQFSANAKNAPVVHFNGPLTLDLFYDQEPLRSGQTVDFSVVVGTRGEGRGTFAHVVCGSYPKGAWPTAVIEFPARKGEKPIVSKIRLADD
jgi:hypothetical protein